MPATASPFAVARDRALARLGADRRRRPRRAGRRACRRAPSARRARCPGCPAAARRRAGRSAPSPRRARRRRRCRSTRSSAVDDLADGEAVLDEPLRADEHLVLLHLAAEAVHLVHAGDRLEQRRDDPVLDACAGPSARARRPRACTGRSRRGRWRSGPSSGLDAGRQLLARRGEPLEDHLPRPVGVGAVLEDDDHLRQLGLRERPDLLHAREAAQSLLDGEADTRCSTSTAARPGRLREDHHLRVRHVGEGVDGEARPGDQPPADGERGRDEQDEEAVARGAR